ncbi:MAG TPA: ATP-binding protein [Thermoanaerobaculia bacterium]|nr:ATP-binding protein [Thermoanaerobaculia bacterium]
MEPVKSPSGEGDGFVAVDGQWRIAYAHGISMRALGLSLEEVIGRDLWEVFPMYLGTGTEEICRRVMRERKPERNEVLGTLTGRWYEAHIYPSGDGICLYGRDITDRRLGEEALRRSEERYRALAEAVSTAVWFWDPVTHRGDYASTQSWWCAITGQTSEEQSEWGRLGWIEAIHPEDRDKVRAVWSASMERGQPYEVEYRVCTPDGGDRVILARAVAVREPDGRVREWVGMLSDVTESRRAEEALREADRRKDEFLAMLAHELRNPLAPIRSSAEALRRLVPQVDARGERALRMIDRQVVHMTRLVDDLLDVSRISRGKILLRQERLDLVQLVRATVEDHRSLLEDARLTLDAELPGEPLWLTGDPTRLAQILGNLLQNAAKFTNAGGTVIVRLHRAPDADAAVLDVEDTGIGMDSEMLGRLFEPFSQADRSLARSRGGLGLGLALVKGLVDLHGATIEASSGGSGAGARFIVRFPLSNEPAAAEPAPAAETSAASRSVLVIEDYADAAESLRLLLELAGHQVEVASTGRAGIDAARRLRPDVVLCDIGLPGGLDGYDVARALRESRELDATFLIALTGYGQEEDRRRALEAGFDRHMTKPVDPAALDELLRAPLRR